MNYLPDDILFMIYKNVHTIDVLPELKDELERIRVEQCIKQFPFVKNITFIANFSDVHINKVLSIVNNNNKIYKIFNNLYNITFYYHKDNVFLI